MLIPRIILTLGEPAGIGPDCVLQLLKEKFPAEIIIVGDENILRHRAKLLNEKYNNLEAYQVKNSITPGFKILQVNAENPDVCGASTAANAQYILKTLTIAAEKCLAKECQGLVTAPLQKSVINEAGIHFVGVSIG